MLTWRPLLLLLAPIALVAAFVAACDDGDGGSTGVAELDAVIAEFEAPDIPALRARVRLSTLACTLELGAGGPPKCWNFEGATQQTGTLVDAFEFYTCEPDWVDAPRVTAILDEVTASPLTRHAAFEAPADYQPGGRFRQQIAVAPATHVAVFQAARRGVAVVLDGDAIVALWHTCDFGAEILVPEGHSDFLLAPPG